LKLNTKKGIKLKKNYSIKIPLKENSYEVIVGTNIINKYKNKIFSTIKNAKKIFIVTDTKIKKLHLKKIIQIISKKYTVKTLVIKPGEKMKDIKTINKIVTVLLKNKISRNDAIFALGGGVIGDISGFLANITLRGIKLVHFPTTLLAQVDSSIGGKTGVNSSYGKNLIGTFYQPNLVVCDTIFLSTLPKRELIAGYAEVIKYGIINDKNFFNWLNKNTKKLLNNSSSEMIKAIKRSVEIKKEFIIKDEKDLNNKRALLNFGHTFAHSLESFTKYSKILLHGEAVSIGICMASKLSNNLGFLSLNNYLKIKNIFYNFGLPINLVFLKKIKIQKKQILKNMIYDKKNLSGKLNFILCKDIGKAFVYSKIKKETINKSIN
jgi:3-dehydroquinate synthase